jgi:hypothetical protein
VRCALPASGTVSGGDEREHEGKVPHRKGLRSGGALGRGDGVAPSCRKVVASRRLDASSVAGFGKAKEQRCWLKAASGTGGRHRKRRSARRRGWRSATPWLGTRMRQGSRTRRRLRRQGGAAVKHSSTQTKGTVPTGENAVARGGAWPGCGTRAALARFLEEQRNGGVLAREEALSAMDGRCE